MCKQTWVASWTLRGCQRSEDPEQTGGRVPLHVTPSARVCLSVDVCACAVPLCICASMCVCAAVCLHVCCLNCVCYVSRCVCLGTKVWEQRQIF